MAILWRRQRQLFFFGIFAVIVIAAVGTLIYFFNPEPTCFDKKQNQSEEGIDCGGQCVACVGNPQSLVVLWTRFFETAPGYYEVASLIQNSNISIGVPKLVYRIRLYDSNNILIAIKQGSTFLNPQETFLIYEPQVETLERTPARATIEFSEPSWVKLEKEKPQLLVIKKEFTNSLPDAPPGASLSATIQNQALFPVENIILTGILYDAGENAIGVSVSKINRIEGEGRVNVIFTWRRSFDPPPAALEISSRTNLFEK